MTFWVLLHPAPTEGCTATLPASAFRSALAPVHIAAAAVLSVCLALLSASLRGARPGAPTLSGLGATWAYVAICLADEDLFGAACMIGLVAASTVGLVAASTVGLVAVLALLIRMLLTLRSSLPAAARWRAHGFSLQVLLWGALVVGLPARFALAWLSGADLFCF
ncbi:MAG TPA: hypothetical protein VGJ70_06715 [Solirubrobacteraceae bacterium]